MYLEPIIALTNTRVARWNEEEEGVTPNDDGAAKKLAIRQPFESALKYRYDPFSVPIQRFANMRVAYRTMFTSFGSALRPNYPPSIQRSCPPGLALFSATQSLNHTRKCQYCSTQ